jgi:mRNA interferase MazF
MAPPRGSEPGFRHPVLVVQSDDFNESAIRSVVVVTMTSNSRLALSRGNVVVSRRESGLEKVSVINVSQVVTLDRSRLTRLVGSVSEETLQVVEEGLRSVLGL